jgi:hypothetical protein
MTIISACGEKSQNLLSTAVSTRTSTHDGCHFSFCFEKYPILLSTTVTTLLYTIDRRTAFARENPAMLSAAVL